MIEQEIVQVEKYVDVALICDKCGRRAVINGDNFDADNGQCEAQEFIHLEIRGGYLSVFGDGQRYEVDLCQHCVKELLGQYLRHISGLPLTDSVTARPIDLMLI